MNCDNILHETRELLKARRARESLRQIAEGAGINYHWLGKFSQGQFENPGVVTIQALHKYLSVPGDRRA